MESKQEISAPEFYPNSPIILSILQFRYDQIKDFDVSKYKEMFIQEYPLVQERVRQSVKVNRGAVGAKTTLSLDQNVEGLKFESSDKKKNFAISDKRLSVELHGEYLGWDNFIEEAKKIWNAFTKIENSIVLTGISLRFINRINLPINTRDLSDYFTTYLNSSSGEHSINSFQLRYTSNDKADNIKNIITHALEMPIGDVLPYIFDIDTILVDDINDENDLWGKFNLLRSKKNSIFNDGITDLTKDLIR